VDVAANDRGEKDARAHFVDGDRAARDDGGRTLADRAGFESRDADEALRNVDFVGFELAHGAAVDGQVRGRGDVFDSFVAVAGGRPVALSQSVLLRPT